MNRELAKEVLEAMTLLQQPYRGDIDSEGWTKIEDVRARLRAAIEEPTDATALVVDYQKEASRFYLAGTHMEQHVLETWVRDDGMTAHVVYKFGYPSPTKEEKLREVIDRIRFEESQEKSKRESADA